jgi:rhamnosyltransferase
MIALEELVVIYLAYHPSEEDLSYVRALASETRVVVVSNSGLHDFGMNVSKAAIFEENVGVGAGYNAGLDLARGLNARYVMFHDQDSRVDRATLESALSRLKRIESSEHQSVLSLNPRDIQTGTSRTARFTKPVMQFSGLLANISLFDKNAFSAELFVDFVDSDWCWRTSSDVAIFRDAQLSIGHNLGSGTRTLFGLEYSLPSPTRYFFQARNLVVLTGRTYVPKFWPVQTAGKFLLRSALLPFIEPRYRECWKQSWLGIKEGFATRTRGAEGG